MNVIVQSKTVVVTEGIRSFVRQQVRKFLHRGQRISNITVFIESVRRKKNDTTAATAKFLVDLPGKNLVVQERANDMYLAIAEAARATLRKVRKTKEKRATRFIQSVRFGY